MPRYNNDVQRVLDLQNMNPNERAHEAQRMGNEERPVAQKKALWAIAEKARQDRDSD